MDALASRGYIYYALTYGEHRLELARRCSGGDDQQVAAALADLVRIANDTDRNDALPRPDLEENLRRVLPYADEDLSIR
jgi:hypothetical protein